MKEITNNQQERYKNEKKTGQKDERKNAIMVKKMQEWKKYVRINEVAHERTKTKENKC